MVKIRNPLCTFDHLSWWRRSLEKTNLSPSPTAFVPLSIKSNALHINIIQVFEHTAQQFTTDYNLTLPFLMRMIPPDWTTTVPFHQYLTSVSPQEERKKIEWHLFTRHFAASIVIDPSPWSSFVPLQESLSSSSIIIIIITIINGLFYGEGMCIFDKDSSWAIIIKDMKVDPTWKVVGLLLPHSLAWDCFHLQIGSFFSQSSSTSSWFGYLSFQVQLLSWYTLAPWASNLFSLIIWSSSPVAYFATILTFGWYWVFEEIRVWTFFMVSQKKSQTQSW